MRSCQQELRIPGPSAQFQSSCLCFWHSASPSWHPGTLHLEWHLSGNAYLLECVVYETAEMAFRCYCLLGVKTKEEPRPKPD